MVKKDLLKIMTGINNDRELNPNEKVLLSSLILDYDTSCGYASAMYEHLMMSLSTNRRSKISITLKSLVDKGYIEIKKIRGNKNIYYIHKHLYLIDKKKRTRATKTTKTTKTKSVGTKDKKVIVNVDVNVSY